MATLAEIAQDIVYQTQERNNSKRSPENFDYCDSETLINSLSNIELIDLISEALERLNND